MLHIAIISYEDNNLDSLWFRKRASFIQLLLGCLTLKRLKVENAHLMQSLFRKLMSSKINGGYLGKCKLNSI